MHYPQDGITKLRMLSLIMIAEMVARVHEDPVGRNWCVDGQEMKVRVEVSSVAMGIVLEVNSNVIEDAS